MIHNFFIISVVKENARPKLAVTIPTRTPIALVKEIIDIINNKEIKSYQNNRRQQYIY